MKFWVCVVSKEHALRGINGEFVQACHGKRAPLARMKSGDCVTFYCPNLTFLGKEKYQKFLGFGTVKTGQVYQFQMSDDFIPFRLDVEFTPNSDQLSVNVYELIEKLEFIKDKRHWGFMFRFGHFEISQHDYELIVNKMNY